jgi:hypothetical protein
VFLFSFTGFIRCRLLTIASGGMRHNDLTFTHGDMRHNDSKFACRDMSCSDNDGGFSIDPQNIKVWMMMVDVDLLVHRPNNKPVR